MPRAQFREDGKFVMPMYFDEGGYHRYRDEHGRPVTRTKEQYPYSYDPFVVWGSAGRATGSAYTDRLSQWDYKKYESLRKKHFEGCHGSWSYIPQQKITAFLREYLGDPELEVTLLMECCNVATGYPVWRLDYCSGEAYLAQQAEAAEQRRRERGTRAMDN